jgi:hypothetical protein
MPGESQYKMQKKCEISKTYFYMDEHSRGWKENSKNRRGDKIKNRKNINNVGNTVHMHPTRLIQAVMFY